MQTSQPSKQEAKKLSILIVDDEPDILKIFKKSLEIAGHSTYGFVNPSAALEHYRQNPKAYDLIVSDIRMPGLSGFEFVREVRKVNKDIRVILMTSFEVGMKEMKTVLPSLKIDDLVDKPISITKLLEIIDPATNSRNKR